MVSKTVTGLSHFDDTTSELNRTEFIVRQVLNRMATATLVEVMAVAGDTVDVRPMVAQIDGAGNVISHGTIHNVPFFTLRAGSSAIIMKPVDGDFGLAVFCHNDISSAKKNKAASNPGSRRKFDWADALYLGGFFGAAPTQYIKLDSSGITMHTEQPIALHGSAINVTGDMNVTGNVATTGNVSVTGNISATGNLSADGTSTLAGKNFATHTHSGVTIGTGNSGEPV